MFRSVVCKLLANPLTIQHGLSRVFKNSDFGLGGNVADSTGQDTHRTRVRIRAESPILYEKVPYGTLPSHAIPR